VRPTDYTVTFTPRDLPGVLDMLRYEQATVLDWTSPADQAERWTVRLRNPRGEPVKDRWMSFGLYPKQLTPSA
jgi:hypothetical protein